MSSDADVRVSSTSSGRSEAKIELSGLQFFFAQPKSEVREDEHGDGVILLDNGSKPNIFKNKLMVNNTRNLRYNMELATNAGRKIIEEEADVTGFGKLMFSRDTIANIFVLIELRNVCRVTHD